MSLSLTSNNLPPPTLLGSMAAGFWVSRAIYVAAKLRIADLLAQGPQSAEFLAEKTQSNPDALFRLLRALVAFGLFTDHNEDGFGLTELGDALRSDNDESMRDYVMMLGQPESWRAWEHIEHSITTGAPAFDYTFGCPFFPYLAANPPVGQIFDKGMRSRGVADDNAVVAAYDFSEFSRIVDLGGGAGRLLSTVLKSAPRATGILFDLPHVVEATRKSLTTTGVRNRIKIVAGDFFEAVPAGADLYLLKQVLHDWSDEQVTKLFANCRRGMAAKSRMLILELIVGPESPPFAKLLDLMMLVWTGGRERTRDEYERLLAGADLKLIRVLPTSTLICVLEAAPAGTN